MHSAFDAVSQLQCVDRYLPYAITERQCNVLNLLLRPANANPVPAPMDKLGRGSRVQGTSILTVTKAKPSYRKHCCCVKQRSMSLSVDMKMLIKNNVY